jgi:hypothetical protein
MIESKKERKITPKKELVTLDAVTRMDLIMVLYEATRDKHLGYGAMHKAAKSLQELLETKYNFTLGYGFSDPSVFEIWDNKFQEDIERLDVLGRVLDNSDILVGGTEGYYTHVLKPRDPEADIMLRAVGKQNLERKLGIKLEMLLKDVKKYVQ